MKTDSIQIPKDHDFANVSAKRVNKTWVNLTDPFKAPVPALEFIVDGYCAKGLITVIGGSAGSGKSLFNQILFSRRNNELLTTHPGKALYLTGADSSEFELRRRAKTIGENNGLFTAELPNDLFCVVTNDIFFNELSEQITKQNIDTVIFDTIADYHEGSLYEAEKANCTMRAFNRLARERNVSVILITHTRKGSKIKERYNVEDISDSRIFATKSDFVFGLKSEYQSDRSNLIELQCVKSRSAEPLQPIRAEIYFNSETNDLRIEKSDRMFSAELEILNETQKREHTIKEVQRLTGIGKTTREVAKILSISTGAVSKYNNINLRS